jgi:hypothetical protein
LANHAHFPRNLFLFDYLDRDGLAADQIIILGFAADVFSKRAAYHVDELNAGVRLGLAWPDVPDQSSIKASCQAYTFECVPQGSFESRIVTLVINYQFFEAPDQAKSFFDEQVPSTKVLDQPADRLVPDDLLLTGKDMHRSPRPVTHSLSGKVGRSNRRPPRAVRGSLQRSL